MKKNKNNGDVSIDLTEMLTKAILLKYVKLHQIRSTEFRKSFYGSHSTKYREFKKTRK